MKKVSSAYSKKSSAYSKKSSAYSKKSSAYSKKSSAYILGISESHTASAVLLCDGEIIACASEERFSGKKLQAGIPRKAIEFCLNYAGITNQDLDLVALADLTPPVFGNFVKKDYIDSPGILTNAIYATEELLERNFKNSREWFFNIYKQLRKTNLRSLQQARITKYQKLFNLPQHSFEFLEHHLCHAASALFSSPTSQNHPILIFTADGVGDFLCATIYKFQNSQIKKLIEIDSQQSLGFFYQHITQFLGLRANEDEYKIMGLAPYADTEQAQQVYKILRPFFQIQKSANKWRIKISEYHLCRKLPTLLRFRRFDAIAAAAQMIIEEILVDWIKNAVSNFKISRVVCGGGVFANIKLNQKIAEVAKIDYSFFMPTPGDESNAIGAAYLGYFHQSGLTPKPLQNLYLGPEYSDSQVLQAIAKNTRRAKFSFKKSKDINSNVAKLLAKGEVVARFSGRMEFGARALGNRSILADPSNLAIVEKINSSIKNRDFWMPFAPTILRGRAKDYLVPGKADSPFMNVGFNTTALAQSKLTAAIHPYDKTCRPQILDQQTNPSYYDLIKKFEKLTGIGAVLNTSFNLHRQPIVCSPEDALRVLLNSQLKYLAINNYLITKR